MNPARIFTAVALIACLSLWFTRGYDSRAESGGTVDRWVAHKGGLAKGQDQARVVSLARPLLQRCTGVHVTVQVLNTDVATAFSWPSGRVFVTRGLVRQLSDDELTAAVAHELGHLLNDGHLRARDPGVGPVDSLSGNSRGLNVELRADRTALKLLAACSVPRDSLLHLLMRLENDKALPALARHAMAERIRQAATPAT